MIRNDWRLARLALQVIAEQGPGQAVAQAQAQEDAALAASLKALGG